MSAPAIPENRWVEILCSAPETGKEGRLLARLDSGVLRDLGGNAIHAEVEGWREFEWKPLRHGAEACGIRIGRREYRATVNLLLFRGTVRVDEPEETLAVADTLAIPDLDRLKQATLDLLACYVRMAVGP